VSYHSYSIVSMSFNLNSKYGDSNKSSVDTTSHKFCVLSVSTYYMHICSGRGVG